MKSQNIPCYVSEQLLRLDRATHTPCTTQVPGLSVLPKKHRHKQQERKGWELHSIINGV